MVEGSKKVEREEISMWTRAELKDRAKTAVRRNYWICVLVALILLVLVEGGGTTSNAVSSNSDSQSSSSVANQVLNEDGEIWDEEEDGISYSQDDSSLLGSNSITKYITKGVTSKVSGAGVLVENLLGNLATMIVIIMVVAAIAVGIFVSNVIEVGGCRFFLQNREEKANLKEILYGFKNGNYGNIVLTQFLRDLYTFLWTLLFIVPGIIKGYEYYMIPYLLAENPEMEKDEAFRLSKQMMDGHKWEAFVLEWSFILWDLLDGITFGIAGIFWVNPYKYATKAEFYHIIKNGGDLSA